jgi:hypothetical protein
VAILPPSVEKEEWRFIMSWSKSFASLTIEEDDGGETSRQKKKKETWTAPRHRMRKTILFK